jgi:hypothetical protein
MKQCPARPAPAKTSAKYAVAAESEKMEANALIAKEPGASYMELAAAEDSLAGRYFR